MVYFKAFRIAYILRVFHVEYTIINHIYSFLFYFYIACCSSGPMNATELPFFFACFGKSSFNFVSLLLLLFIAASEYIKWCITPNMHMPSGRNKAQTMQMQIHFCTYRTFKIYTISFTAFHFSTFSMSFFAICFFSFSFVFCFFK